MSASVLDQTERRLFDTEDGSSPAVVFGAMPAGAGGGRVGSLVGRSVNALRRLHAGILPERGRAWLQNVRSAIAAAISLELARGTAFSFVPVLLVTGALAYFFASVEPPVWLLAAGCALALAAAFACGRWAAARMAFVALFCVALGALLAKAETSRAGTQMLGSEISTRLTGRIVSIDQLANGRVRMLVDVMATERPTLRFAPDRVRVSARSMPHDAKAGDTVSGVVRLLPPSGPTRPGGYDFSFASYFDGIGAVGFFLTAPARADISEPASWSSRLLGAVENARDALAARIRSRIGGAEGEIAAALIAGVRAGIPEEVNESLRRTGLAHILSISGLHMALVAAWIMGAMRCGFACFQNFAVRHPVRKYAAVVALFALGAYLFISGYQVAAQRSFIMIAIMLTAVLFDRAALTMRNLALAAIVIMVLSPHEAAGPSFQMSFGATVALIGAYAAWSERKRRHPPSPGTPLLPKTARTAALYVGGLAATSLLAGAATAIFGAYHFQRVSPLGLVANLAAMPIVSLLVMPFALLGVLLMPLGLDGIAFSVMGWGLRMVLAVSDWVSGQSPLDAVGIIPSQAVILLSIALVLAFLLTTWLRVAALPFAALGLFACISSPQPKIFIAEDARLVAVASADGAIHVNRKRPNAFAIRDWQRAVAADAVARPTAVEGGAAFWDRVAADDAAGPEFRCGETACIATSDAGIIVTTADQSFARSACGRADVIVLEDATANNICKGAATTVLTARDLAMRGAAMIFDENSARDRPAATTARRKSDGGRDPREHGASVRIATQKAVSDAPKGDAPPAARNLQVRFATPVPHRPWHAHRRFSRAARGLAPWKPSATKTDKAGEPAAGITPVQTPHDANIQRETRPAGSDPTAAPDPAPD